VIYLLDTNAISALMRADAQMASWLSSIGVDDRVVICTIARGEILFGLERLAQVRHKTGRRWAKPFRISSGNGRVYTTFSIEFESIGEADVELLKEGSLFGVGFGDTAETKLAASVVGRMMSALCRVESKAMAFIGDSGAA